jgi:photosystem I P700 chlorophyll a apoprotein A2
MFVGLAAHVTVLAQKYRDPDSPEVQAAARAALAHAKILDVVGITRGIEGTLKDLGAKVSGQEIRIALSADVLFDFDSFALRADASNALRKVADVLKEYAKSPVLIEGHTDGKGADQYNQTLSERRADSVKRWLVEQGRIDGSRIQTKGWGKMRPIAPNAKPDGSDDPEGRQKNRRVEIVVNR